MPYLFPADRALPYASDGPLSENTSRTGAEAIAPDAAAVRWRYYCWLWARREFGATDQEAADALGIDRTTLIPRRHELDKLVMDSGKRRHRIVQGRRASSKVWIATRWA